MYASEKLRPGCLKERFAFLKRRKKGAEQRRCKGRNGVVDHLFLRGL